MRQSTLISFLIDALKSATTGSKKYHIWMGILTFIMIVGAGAYYVQLRDGLIRTGMHDYVSWGLYISNFTFLVGVAAASIMLVVPAYILKDVDFPRAVLIGEGVAVAALIMCLAFVTADMGSPERLWHIIPLIGFFNWPQSMLTWDVLVLNGYLLLNLGIPFYLLFTRYQGKEVNKKYYLFFILLSVFWAISIHLVTAFLYAGLPARPFWHSSLLGPRFLASAFAAGPALIIIILEMINKFTEYEIRKEIIHKLSLIATVAAQVSLIMLGSEFFKEFYYPTEHSHSAKYLFFGLHGKSALVPWMWSAIALMIISTVILSIHRLRNNFLLLNVACILLFVGIWIEKGMGLIVPGFIPSTLGQIVEYSPSLVEILVTLGIWALGAFVFTVLVKVALPIELGTLRKRDH